MKRTRWSVGLRNKLSSLAMDCDSVTAIEEAKMSVLERETLQRQLLKVVEWIDKRIKI